MRIIFILIQLMIVESLYSQNSSKDLYFQAEREENSGRSITAIDFYSKAIELDSTYAKAYFGRARSYYRVWLARNEKDNLMYNNFLNDINKSISLDSTDCLCNFWVADNTGLNNDTALKLYNRAILYCDDNEAFFSHRAVCFMHLGKFQSAINDIDKAIKLSKKREDPETIKGLKEHFLGERAICYAKLNNFKTAEKDIMQAIESNNTEYNYYLYLGTIKALKGEYKDALEQFSGILKRNPLVAVCYLFIGNVYKKMNEQGLAEHYWSIAESKGIKLTSRYKDVNSQLDYFIEVYSYGIK